MHNYFYIYRFGETKEKLFMEQLTNKEEEVIQVLWNIEKGFIKDILTDPLLGGGIRMYVESPLTASETLALKNAVVTVRI